MKTRFALVAVLVVLISSCDVFGGPETSPLHGEIQNRPFIYAWGEAYAAGEGWEIIVRGNENSPYPYVVFTISGEAPKTYAITTFGDDEGGLEGIMVTGPVTPYSGTYFDSGRLTIDLIDSSVIKGSILNAGTIEGTSSLSGTFSAGIR